MEASLRRRDKWDGGHLFMGIAPPRAAIQAAACGQAVVQFINLPRPPTPAQRDAINPPPGSPDVIIPRVTNTADRAELENVVILASSIVSGGPPITSPLPIGEDDA